MWITRVSIAHPVFATMVMAALCVLGLFAYQRLGVEQMPDVSFPAALVNVQYPGATPDAVEREVLKPLEESVNGIAGVKKITSRALEGQAQMFVEFSLDADMGRQMQELRDRVGAVQPAFPRDARAPLVVRMQEDEQQPVVAASLVSTTRSARELSVLADEVVARRLARVAGVARVVVAGAARREVRIDLDPLQLAQYQVTPAQIAAALKEANADQPVGIVSDPRQDTILRVEGRVRDPRDFAGVVVARRGPLSLTVGDLARVVEREAEATTLARLNGKPAIALNVFKQQDANIVAAGDGVKAAMDELRAQLPPGVELATNFAASDWVKGSLTGLRHTLVEGALLTVAIVFLFLHSWRSTIITGLTLPISVIASFIAIHAAGYTLNFMTMMALSLCIGLLIDDAIVVRENIVRHAQAGKSHARAAREGTDEIGLAVMATTFAICAVFVPVAFMGGIIGKFFRPFGITVVVAVLVSLFVSFTLDPMLSSVWPDPPGQAARMRRLPVIGTLMRWTDDALDALHALYGRVLRWAFSPRRWRVPLPLYALPVPAWHGIVETRAAGSGPTPPVDPAAAVHADRPARRWRRSTITPRAVVLLAGVGSLLAALALVPLVGSEFMPRTDQGFTQLNLTLPVGSSLERTDAKVRQIEEIVRALPEVESVSTMIGNEGQRNTANLAISLKERRARARTQFEVEDDIRARIAPIAGLESSLGWERPIYVAILGADAQALAREAHRFADAVRKIPGAIDVEVSAKPGVPALGVRLEPEAIRELGLTGTQVAANLRAYVNGEAATQWTAPDGTQVDVLLRLDATARQRAGQLQDLPVAFAADGTPVPLARVATLVPIDNPQIIRRQDLQRREAVFASVKDRSPGDVSADVQALMKGWTLPPGLHFDIGGQMQQQAEAFSGLVGAMALAVMFIYIVLASQFGSFLQPLAIMASLPLALIGVMLALLLWRSTLNVFSMIGLVMLMGLVTKNAILLVDFANHARRAGASIEDALLQAGQTRMRPIVMTTAAMVFGMLPLSLALNDGGELQAPMGRAIIGGVITSTLLTLVVVPVLYSYVARRRPRAWDVQAELGPGASDARSDAAATRPPADETAAR